MIRALAIVLALATPAAAQDAVEATVAEGAVLRGLDKVNGELTDYELTSGGSATLGNLTIQLGECRYPTGNPSGDAFAYVTVQSDTGAEPLFHGWMLASSPALNALDHPRYDIWVLRCITS